MYKYLLYLYCIKQLYGIPGNNDLFLVPLSSPQNRYRFYPKNSDRYVLVLLNKVVLVNFGFGIFKNSIELKKNQIWKIKWNKLYQSFEISTINTMIHYQYIINLTKKMFRSITIKTCYHKCRFINNSKDFIVKGNSDTENKYTETEMIRILNFQSVSLSTSRPLYKRYDPGVIRKNLYMALDPRTA